MPVLIENSSVIEKLQLNFLRKNMELRRVAETYNNCAERRLILDVYFTRSKFFKTINLKIMIQREELKIANEKKIMKFFFPFSKHKQSYLDD